MNHRTQEYRPDIDGLRAISIISVLIFHTFPDVLPGGFLGVDIFFVISGYLIFNIIYRSITNNNFSFFIFYKRRINRIFPSLSIVLLCSLVYAYYFINPNDYKTLCKHILSGVFFVTNFLLYSESGYFDVTSETKPFLHIWSLSIEEQFYLIFPIIVYVAIKKNTNLLSILVIIFSISFASFLFYLKMIQHILFTCHIHGVLK